MIKPQKPYRENITLYERKFDSNTISVKELIDIANEQDIDYENLQVAASSDYDYAYLNIYYCRMQTDEEYNESLENYQKLLKSYNDDLASKKKEKEEKIKRKNLFIINII